MVYDGVIEGRYVDLKSCAEEDAEFTLALRQNPILTKYLPRLDISLQQQVAWIKKQRETAGDYFFVVWDKTANPIGTVSIYDVTGETSESGRLALIGNAYENTEASMLLFHFAFDILGLKEVRGYIVDGNKRADRYNRQFGCLTGEPEYTDTGETIRKTLITDVSFHEAETRLQKLLYRSE